MTPDLIIQTDHLGLILEVSFVEGAKPPYCYKPVAPRIVPIASVRSERLISEGKRFDRSIARPYIHLWIFERRLKWSRPVAIMPPPGFDFGPHEPLWFQFFQSCVAPPRKRLYPSERAPPTDGELPVCER